MMGALEWLLMVAVVWSVFFLYCAFDIPTLVGHRKRARR